MDLMSTFKAQRATVTIPMKTGGGSPCAAPLMDTEPLLVKMFDHMNDCDSPPRFEAGPGEAITGDIHPS